MHNPNALRLAAFRARAMLAAHMSETFGPDEAAWRETVFWEAYAALGVALAFGSVTLPGYPGEAFHSLHVTAQHEAGGDYFDPTQERPANLYSVRAWAGDVSYVLTDHATPDDADAAAKLISGLTGLPIET